MVAGEKKQLIIKMGLIKINIQSENGVSKLEIKEENANFADLGVAITQLELAKTQLLLHAAKMANKVGGQP